MKEEGYQINVRTILLRSSRINNISQARMLIIPISLSLENLHIKNGSILMARVKILLEKQNDNIA